MNQFESRSVPSLLPCPMCGGEAAMGTNVVNRQVDDKGTYKSMTGYSVNCIWSWCGVSNRTIAEGYATPELAAERWNRRAARSETERSAAALHACDGLDTVDLAKNKRGWLAEVVMSATRVENERNRALMACCAGNTDDYDPVRCQSYEASEQSAPCPAGCCVMADAKDVRATLEAIEREEGCAHSATGASDG